MEPEPTSPSNHPLEKTPVHFPVFRHQWLKKYNSKQKL